MRRSLSWFDTLNGDQTWIDERLFGWSRNANRGTSAWGGSTPGQDSSRPETPDESDEEDHGDYDHVIGYLPAYEDASRSKLRSRQGSYADLQRLRMTPTSQTSSSGVQISDGQSLHMRPRQRKQSLTDLVPVERLASVDRQEPLQDVTMDLNKEISGNTRT
jgi:glycerol-3-phosphate O-acyltransferase/dihydroxyacetone phosphate acyltransferase